MTLAFDDSVGATDLTGAMSPDNFLTLSLPLDTLEMEEWMLLLRPLRDFPVDDGATTALQGSSDGRWSLVIKYLVNPIAPLHCSTS